MRKKCITLCILSVLIFSCTINNVEVSLFGNWKLKWFSYTNKDEKMDYDIMQGLDEVDGNLIITNNGSVDSYKIDLEIELWDDNWGKYIKDDLFTINYDQQKIFLNQHGSLFGQFENTNNFLIFDNKNGKKWKVKYKLECFKLTIENVEEDWEMIFEK